MSCPTTRCIGPELALLAPAAERERYADEEKS